MRWVVLLFCLPILVQAQGDYVVPYPSSNLTKYTSLFQESESAQTAHSLEIFADKLELKRLKQSSDKDFLQYLFRKTHNQFLHSYTEYSTFSELLDKGDYNCLTGTALYALLLDHFGFDYTIIETNYHIFLIAKMSTGSVLIEATDPENGFVARADEIEKRITSYKQNVIQHTKLNKSYYHFNFELFNTVTLDQMAGLLYYNSSVKAYNDQQLERAIRYLDKAFKLYQSPRIDEFSKILLLTVSESNLDQNLKARYVRQLQQLRKKNLNFVASAATEIQ